MIWNVDIITGTRAEFGLLKPLITRMCGSAVLNPRIIVTGAHLMESQGKTEEEISLSGFSAYARIPLPDLDDSKRSMAECTGAAIGRFASHFADDPPDCVVVLGDRYEIFAAAISAVMMGVPVAHICGGELTYGAVDDVFRHSITKMSSLHFATRDEYRRRIIQMGEAPNTVFNVGQLGVENVFNVRRMSLAELENSLGFALGDDYCIVTYHPVTQNSGESDAGFEALLKAMERFPDMSFLITKANADAGGARINACWAESSHTHPRWKVVSSLGMERYISALSNARLMLGNSSSGLTEAPALGVPTVNIGSRQMGRIVPGSVISCPPTADSIEDAIRTALSPSFRDGLKPDAELQNGRNTSEGIVRELESFLAGGAGPLKRFFDIQFDEQTLGDCHA